MSRNGREYILNLLPEIKKIKDIKLRGTVLDVWIKAMKMGGWERIEDVPFTLLIPGCSVSLIEHVRAVINLCINVAEVMCERAKSKYNLSVNRDYLIAGAALHDVGKLLEYKNENGKVIRSKRGKLLRHPFIGVWLALQCGVTDEVAHIIATHSDEGNIVNRSPEAVIVHFCDFAYFDFIKMKHAS